MGKEKGNGEKQIECVREIERTKEGESDGEWKRDRDRFIDRGSG